jgi:hypothetical protein
MEDTREKTWEGQISCPVHQGKDTSYADALIDLRSRVRDVLQGQEHPPCFFAYTARHLWEQWEVWKLAIAFRWWNEAITQYLSELDSTQKLLLRESSLVWIYAVLGYIIGINWNEKIKPWVQSLLDWIRPNRIITGETYRQVSGTEELWEKMWNLWMWSVQEELFLQINKHFWRISTADTTVNQIITGGINTALNEFWMLMMATTKSYSDDFGYTHKDEILTTLRNSLPLLKKQSTLPMEATIRQPHLTWRIREWDTMVLEEEAERKMHAILLKRWEKDPTELYRLWCPIWYSNLPVFTELFEILLKHVEGNFGKK